MLKNSRILSLLAKQPWWWFVAVIGALLGGLYFLRSGAKTRDVGITFVARRGPLDVTVLQGGSIESEEKGEIKCQVKGGQGVKILKIVPEGYQVIEDDVQTNKVLVELDSSELLKQLTQQEITFGSTAASLTDAQQAYEIQLNQNLSDIMAAVQKGGFARMDFDKYMGDQAAREVITQLGVPTEQEEEGTPQNAATNLAAAMAPATLVASATALFSKYANIDVLGDGEAKQKLRELQDTVQMAQKELQQAQTMLEGTKRLFEQSFVNKIERERDQLAYDNGTLKVKKAETALGLFMKYEFPKAAQEALSKYTESLRELDRTRKGAVSKLAQAEAKLKSAQAKFSLEERQLKELRDQISDCTIKAPRPGLVVYGSGGEVMYWREEEQIREGATVRERQTVITIPDMRKLCIKVKIHESYIKRIQKEQKVRIVADSFPDRKLEGEVSQVGVLPDSENSWLSPDMKVYRTTITITGQHDWIRPGMSTKVQILVNQLKDVVYVPIQAVTPREDKKACYVVEGNKVEQREVEIGEFNDEFIEIKKGIKEGEKVCLRTPVGLEEEGSGKGGKKAPASKEKTTPDNNSSPAAAPSSN